MIFPFLAHTECALELRTCLQMQSVENLKWAIITVGVSLWALKNWTHPLTTSYARVLFIQQHLVIQDYY